jgi:hypothetical protein
MTTTPSRNGSKGGTPSDGDAHTRRERPSHECNGIDEATTHLGTSTP